MPPRKPSDLQQQASNATANATNCHPRQTPIGGGWLSPQVRFTWQAGHSGARPPLGRGTCRHSRRSW
eukprot:7303297-Lingulodinium_polyedra.AAC.1